MTLSPPSLGSNFSDHITGNSNANILDGGGGNGGDQLTGLGGADTFVFRSGFLTITDFNQGEGDLIDIRTLNGGAHIEDAQLDALIAASMGDQLDLGNGNVIEVTGIDLQTQLSAANFIHSQVQCRLRVKPRLNFLMALIPSIRPRTLDFSAISA